MTANENSEIGGRYGDWYHQNMWWRDNLDAEGEYMFSFDKKKVFWLFRDYSKMTPEQKEMFDKENPFWEKFFNPDENPYNE